MHGRRRQPRFIASPPWPAALQIVEDVTLERLADESVWVVAKAAAHVGGGLILDVPAGALQVGVTVVTSEPWIVDGRVEHRLHLRITSGRLGGGPGDSGDGETAE